MSSQQEQTSGIKPLAVFMNVEAVAFLLYGIPFFFAPSWSLQVIFGFPELSDLGFFWTRAFGAVFCVVAAVEFLIVRRLSERLDLVWAYVAIPGVILVTIVLERLLGTLEVVPFFFWTTLVVSIFFSAVKGILRLKVKIN